MSRILENQKLSKKMRIKRRNRNLGIVSATIILILIAVYVLVVRSGYWLVQDDAFEHVKWVAVLDGQEADMERSEFAADLLREGKADSVILLGRRVFRDKYNCDFYAEDLLRVGDIDSSKVFLLGHNDPSSLEEAVSLIPWFKAKDVDTVLLVTSAPATARVSYIFNKLSGKKPYFKTVDIHHFSYNPATWASEREARKWWVREIAANILARWDLLFVDTLTADPSKLKTYISVHDENLLKNPVVPQIKEIPRIEPALSTVDSLTSAKKDASDGE